MAKTRSGILENDSGVAYGLYVIGVFLVLGTLLYVSMIEVAQQSNDIMNEFITAGSVTQKTHDVYLNQQNLLTFSPIIMLLGLFCWGIVRALNKKGVEG